MLELHTAAGPDMAFFPVWTTWMTLTIKKCSRDGKPDYPNTENQEKIYQNANLISFTEEKNPSIEYSNMKPMSFIHAV